MSFEQASNTIAAFLKTTFPHRVIMSGQVRYITHGPAAGDLLPDNVSDLCIQHTSLQCRNVLSLNTAQAK